MEEERALWRGIAKAGDNIAIVELVVDASGYMATLPPF